MSDIIGAHPSDRATQASPGAAEASPPSGEYPLRVLAERCEAATELGRLLLLQAFEAVHGEGVFTLQYRSGALGTDPNGEIRKGCDRFLALIETEAWLEAAMTLVPEGCQWTLEPDAAWVRWMGVADVEEAQSHFSGRDGKCTALALCAAALRARAIAIETEGEDPAEGLRAEHESAAIAQGGEA